MGNIRKAADILTNVLQNIQKAKYPGLTAEVDELQSASASIKPGIFTLEQKDANNRTNALSMTQYWKPVNRRRRLKKY